MKTDTTKSKKYYAALRQHLKSFGAEHAAYIAKETGIPRNAVSQFTMGRAKTMTSENIELLEKAGLIPCEIKKLATEEDELEMRAVININIDLLAEHPENKQLLPQLCEADEAELRASLSAEIKPIPFEVLVRPGNGYVVLDGNNRLRILRELAYKGELPCIVLGNVEDEDWTIENQRTAIQKINLARRHMTPDEKKKIAQQMVARGVAVRDVAKVVGLSKSTVADITKKVADARQEAVKEAVTDLKKAGLSQSAIAKEVGISQQSVSDTLTKMSGTGQIGKHASAEEINYDPDAEPETTEPQRDDGDSDGQSSDVYGDQKEVPDHVPGITQEEIDAEVEMQIKRARGLVEENAVLARVEDNTRRRESQKQEKRMVRTGGDRYDVILVDHVHKNPIARGVVEDFAAERAILVNACNDYDIARAVRCMTEMGFEYYNMMAFPTDACAATHGAPWYRCFLVAARGDVKQPNVPEEFYENFSGKYKPADIHAILETMYGNRKFLDVTGRKTKYSDKWLLIEM